MNRERVTCESIRLTKGVSRVVALTAYDYPTARWLDEAGVDILHVGDSLGMVALGLPNTTAVTLDDMVRATEAVARGRARALITADLPAGSYEEPAQAVKAARALVEAGADAIKMEGGRDILAQVRAVIGDGIEVQGHVGLWPQRIAETGEYRRQGKTPEEAEGIVADGLVLQEAGAFSVVVEVVVHEVARRLTDALEVPVIGIGAGPDVDGQIRVTHDILGLTPWYIPGHIKQHLGMGNRIVGGIGDFCRRVRAGENG